MSEGKKIQTAKEASLRFDNVKISLDGRPLVAIDTIIPAGHSLTLMGPSGSGKSSLLAYTAGFLDSAFEASGDIFLNNVEITKRAPEKRRLGLLFQDPLLFPHMSVGGNLAFAIPRRQHLNKPKRQELVEQALIDAGLPDLANRDPSTLSGGQQARIALMRVLLAEPLALLLDEPFSKLDVERRQLMREFVFTQAKQRLLPVLLVTHDPADAEAANGPVIKLGD